MKDVIIKTYVKWGEKMNGLKTTKYMNIFTTLGYFLGFGIIIWYSVFGGNPIMIIVAVIVMFIARTLGYGIDRIIELKEKNKSDYF